MTAEKFIHAFETCSLDEFHHRDHVRLAWLYLRRYPVLEALQRFTQGLIRFAANAGKPGLYHETITWAYLFLIHERMAADEEWESFAERNPDLMTWKPSVLDRYYSKGRLLSDEARRSFVFPDLR
jgi:hypothetical protein